MTLFINEKVRIVIIEDDDSHAELIEEHLQNAGIDNEIKRFINGQEALDFFNSSEFRNSLDLFLVLLDIHMPVMSGIELLKILKSDNELKKMPVIMLTTEDDEREINECYQYGCNCYITKPLDFKKFADTLKRLGLFLQIIKIAKIEN
mgnify:CR=1 FL=1